jgi:hypothetical protein
MTRRRFVATWAVCWVVFGVVAAALVVYVPASMVVDPVFIVALVGALVFSMVRDWRGVRAE